MRIWAFIITAWLMPATLWAQNAPLPDYQATSLTDLAHVITPEDARKIDETLIALYHDTGVQGTVLTLPSRAPYGDASIEALARRIFNQWGVGSREENNGFLVLFLRDDREVRIELGQGYGRDYDLFAQDVITRVMVPQFKDGAFSAGLTDGVVTLADHLRPAEGGGTRRSPRQSWLDYLIPAGVFGFFGFVIFQIGRGFWKDWQEKRRPCPQCGAVPLIRDQFLTADPLLTGDKDGRTRQIRSARCPECGWSERRPGPGSTLIPAPIGMVRDGRRNPTDRGGSGGGFGGGFGGGHSSGGGASGRW